jgi:hypothetical protein
VYAYAMASPFMRTDRNGLTAHICEPYINPGCGPNILEGGGGAGGMAGGAAAGYTLWELMKGIYAYCTQGACPPCKTVSGKVVPIGTIAYRPLDTPSNPQHGIVGPHYNIYSANQIPAGAAKGACNCFWQSVGAVSPESLPTGAIPIEPFAN